MKLSKFVTQYLETTLWSSSDGDNPLDDTYSIDDISAEAIAKAIKDCDDFQAKAGCLLDGLELTDVAHDFWLTRNRHGAGFWDGDYEDSLGLKLTELSHSFGECDLYVGDDGKLYFS